MAANDDVLIVGKLDSKELEKSINDLIDFVGDKTTIMAGKFDSAMDKMKSAMKDFAITQKVSVDLMKEAWKDMSASFDAMFKAQSEASGGGKGSGKGAFDDGTVGQLKELINLEEQRRDKMYLGTEELRKQNELLDEQRAKLRSETTSDPKKLVQQYSSEIKRANLMMDKSLPDAERKLREMLRIKNELRATPVLDADAMAALDKKILVLIGRIRDMRQNARGNTLKDVLGMDESSVDAVARKMRALKSIKVGNASEIHQLGSEYQRLSRLQAELLGKGIQLTHSNNYLAQSFGYIRNRVVYAMTLGAVTNFVKQMYEVRGQYEMLERSLGILIDDMRRGSELFNELNTMAIKSPFTLVELATGAKQLLAYNFAEEEVVDTTRRLADISAALGVPMERLVYNLGQIRAQTALTARDARDFANSGLAIVPMLAQMYTEEKRFGDEIVTTAQVFDMMSNKMVSYADVMKVINSVTDEGGKFFDFQAKQAETLRVKMANLTLAWNNMLNEIGAENQSALTLPVNGLKLLFKHWRMIYEIVRDVAIMYGIYRARAILVAAVNGTLITQGVISGMFQLGRAVGFVASSWKILSAAVAANPIGAIATVLTTAAVAYGLLNDNTDKAAEYQERFGKAGAKVVQETESLFDSLKGISNESSNYKKVLGELNSILEEYGIETVKETDGMDVLNEKRRVAIALIKEETLERKHLNDVQQGRDEYTSTVEEARNKMRSQLKEAVTGMYGFVSENQELRQNASAIANIISNVVEQNITLIAGKTGDEYEKGVQKIYDTIQQRMRDIGISESTISKQWLDDTLFLKNDIVGDFIGKIKDAKEAQDQYIESIDKAYEAEKKATEGGADFNDRVEQTQTQLMKAANDTDNFYKKIDKLIKDYSGLNIIDFLVKVKTEVPAWMSQKGLTELTQLSARFTALATQAKKAGKESLNVNGTEFSVEQLFLRAAQYSQAAQNKAKDIESRKSATITKEASNALKEYKSALDAVAVAKNRVKQGTADNSLVTEKETEAQAKYNKALKAGVSLEELKKAKEGKNKGSKKDPLGDALTKEIQLITEMQKLYKDYQKAGVDADKARIASSNEYKKSLIAQNNVLKSFGINGLDSSELVKMDARQLRDYYKNLREIASIKGNTKGIEALEKAISNLNVEITKVDYKKITDGLNSELGKIKDDYELAVELDANPELGDMFADMFDINTDTLPKTIKEYADKYTQYLNKYLEGNKSDFRFGAGELFNLTQDDINALQSQVQAGTFNQAWFDEIKKAYDDINSKRQKEAQDIFNKTKELEYKLADVNGKIAIEQKKLSDLQIKLQKETDAEKKHLLELHIQDQQNAIDKLKESILELLPTYQLAFGQIAEHSAWMTRRLIQDYKTMLVNAQKAGKNENGKYVVTDPRSGEKTEVTESKLGKEIKNADKELQKTDNVFKKIKESLTKGEDKIVDWVGGIENIGEALGQVGDLVDTIGNVYDMFGNPNEYDETSEAIHDVATSLQGVNTAAKGIGQIASGDVIGGTMNVISGIASAINAWSDNSNKKIDAKIKDSERAVKRLELAYINLEHEVQQAYGMATIGANMAAKANKELQLVELKRQLALERSRDSKNRDEDKIIDLQKQIKELEYDIADTVDSIVNDLLGISSVGDAMESMMDAFVEALRSGEDAMAKFDESVDEMIANMVKKMFTTKILQPWFDEQWNKIQESISARANELTLDYTGFDGKNLSMSLQEFVAKQQNALEKAKNGEYSRFYDRYKALNNEWVVTTRENWIKQTEQIIADAQKQLDEAYTPTVDDIKYYAELLRSGQPIVEEQMKSIEDLLRELGLFGDKVSEQKLSALQQGIQGITEDSAGALEAYMNGVSQQVYYQSDLLAQIRDAVVGIDIDVQVATMSQMLLQLQQSYQVQLAIQNILNGWSNPSGMAVRVEMV